MPSFDTQHGPDSFAPDGALEHGLLEGGETPRSRLVPALLVAAIAASGLSMIFSIGAAVATAGDASESGAASEPVRDAERVYLPVELRNFAPHNLPDGHPDFERFAGGVRVGLVADTLGPDGVPILDSRHGEQIEREFTDAAGRPIRPALADAARDDRPGELEPRQDPRVFSPESFAGWFSGPVEPARIALVRVDGEDRYVFDSDRDPGPLPDGSFTGVVRAELTAGPGLRLGLSSADDAWVYVDGRLAIDLGSAHPRRMQWIDLDRLGLTPGRSVPVDVFFAERRSDDQHFRIETNARLRPVGRTHAGGGN
jgi:fibro-slime domain-containing protein